MRQVIAEVISNEQILPAFSRPPARHLSGGWVIWLKCPEIAAEARPGRFVMVVCGSGCTLPRPFSVHQVNEKGVALFYAVLVSGKGTNWLAQRQAGDKVEIIGTLGNGFVVSPESHNLLLVAGGMGIAPLYYLAQEAKKERCSVTLLYGTANEKRYHSLPSGIKSVAATEDGSVGKSGRVTDLLPEFIDRADQVFACGPMPMYKAMAQMAELRGKPVQVSLEIMMGCGRGVCYGCTIKTRQGLKEVCTDGPVFSLDDVLWDEVSEKEDKT